MVLVLVGDLMIISVLDGEVLGMGIVRIFVGGLKLW